MPQYPDGHCSAHRWECQIYKKNSGVTPRSKVSTGETKKPTGDDMKILRGELTNTLRRRKNTYTRLTQKKRNGWVNFKCQKALWNIALAIKASLRVVNRTQYTNRQMNNAVKNQIYPKKSQYISLDWLFQIIVWNDSLTATKARITAIIRHEKRADMQKKLTSPGV